MIDSDYIDENTSDYFTLVKVSILVRLNCYRNIKWIEDILIKNSDFQQ
ncbi:hypothetical protein [Spiroplasma poulsonii]|nr:hypothetical protein [Spiroplasma poulsonii]UNF61702.1 hypothetical protein MNU24_07265 [Spiroplasma poulsonii]